SESGSSLMAVLILICTMVLIMGAVFLITTGEARFMKRSLDRAVAISYADGVVESLFDQWRAAMSNGQSLSQSDKTLGPTGNTLSGSFNVAVPSSSVLPVPTGCALVSGTVTAANPYGVALSGTSRPTLENGTNSSLLIRMYYSASATVSFPHGGLVTVQRTFTRAGTNIFNNFLFSTQPVTEISPGANMYVNGTIYAGGNLYVSNTTLNLQQDVSYTGSFTVGYAPGDPDGSHQGTAATPSYASGDPPHLGTTQMLIDAVTSEFDQNYIGAGNYADPGVYSSSTNSAVTDKNNKGYHELLEQQTTPEASNIDPMQIDTAGDNERLASNADYRIVVDANNNVTLYTGTNTSPTTSGAAYTAIMNAIITNTAFKDGRVLDTVRAVTVDIGMITTAYNNGAILDNNVYAGKQANDGLLLYIQDTSAGTSVTTNGYNYNISGTSSSVPWRTATRSGTSATITSNSARGVRLVNGGSLPAPNASNSSGGLTIASPNPVYIQGDYNTGSTLTTSGSYSSFSSAGIVMSKQPASDTTAYPSSGTAVPSGVYGSGSNAYAKQASVVAADAVTILSNAWSDSTSAPPMDAATSTTINTAIVSGNVPTTTSNYSGGIENFPRLLEDWSNQNLTIYGSFALLYNSEQATQPWKDTGVYYNAPSRHWFFDSTLQTSNPPGFPAAYSYTRGPWKTQ
ncbi:MAG: hypothetical protein WCD79_22200, partial [Chthoniobacteraceae bacterium]